MVPNWAKNILFLLVYMISGLVLVIIIEGLLSGNELTPLNIAIESVIVHIRTPLMTSFLVFVTKIGNPFIFACVAVFLAVLMILKKQTHDAMLFLITLMVAVLSLTILKNIFQISRPISDVYSVDGWSFPSGHATVATTFFFLLSYLFLKRMRTRLKKTLLIVGSVLGTLLVCFSRLYLGAHWTLDVLAGIALGFLSVSFTVLMFSVFLADRRSVRKIIDL
jgi:undecaprenyl-diphosphatase